MANAQFVELEPLRHPDSVIIPVTYRLRDGKVELSFTIAKEFDRDGRPERSAYLGRRHLAAVNDLLARLPTHLDLLEDRIRTERRAKAL